MALTDQRVCAIGVGVPGGAGEQVQMVVGERPGHHRTGREGDGDDAGWRIPGCTDTDDATVADHDVDGLGRPRPETGTRQGEGAAQARRSSTSGRRLRRTSLPVEVRGSSSKVRISSGRLKLAR